MADSLLPGSDEEEEEEVEEVSLIDSYEVYESPVVLKSNNK